MQRAFSFGIPAACSIAMLVASTTVLAKPASVFMLQFGSFESTQEANQRVDSLKSKHGGLIGDLPSRVLEISLPDNLTVYRTQAGPVSSRAEAQSICAQLASNGDECYVVETAMTSQPATTQMAQAPRTDAVSFAKPDAPVPTLETIGTPAPARDAASLLPETQGVASAAKDAATASGSLSPREQARQTIVNEMSAVKALESAPPLSQGATLKAAAQPVAVKQTETQMERPGFWSRLNPFSDDEPEVKQVKEAPEPVETAVARVESQPVDEPKAVATINAPADAEGAQPRIQLPGNVPVARAVEPASSLPLPPPPTMSSSAQEIFERNRQETPVLTAQAPQPVASVPLAETMPVAPVAPVIASDTPAPFAKASGETLNRLGKPAPAVTPGEGNVIVGEAQRVPLTTALQPVQTPMFVPSGSTVAPADASIPIRTGPRQITPPAGVLAAPEVALPASQDMQKTLWAELRPYKDAPTALGFWDSYRSKNPDFPVVRVRVIQSYAQKLRGDGNVALRVGPFAKQEAIAYLCGQMKAMENLTCGQVTDMGISSSQTNLRSRTMQGEANLATQAMMAQNAPEMQGTYWLQLGSYPSLAQAQNTWSDLKKRYSAAMAGMNPNISVPQLSSGARPIYRLRGGPFTTEVAATKACLAVKSAGGNCLVSGNTQ